MSIGLVVTLGIIIGPSNAKSGGLAGLGVIVGDDTLVILGVEISLSATSPTFRTPNPKPCELMPMCTLPGVSPHDWNFWCWVTGLGGVAPSGGKEWYRPGEEPVATGCSDMGVPASEDACEPIAAVSSASDKERCGIPGGVSLVFTCPLPKFAAQASKYDR